MALIKGAGITATRTMTWPDADAVVVTGATTLTGIIKGNGSSLATAIALPADASQYLDGTGSFSPLASRFSYSLTGSQNDVNVSAASLVLLTSASTSTLTGVVAGTAGKVIVFKNTTSNVFFFRAQFGQFGGGESVVQRGHECRDARRCWRLDRLPVQRC